MATEAGDGGSPAEWKHQQQLHEFLITHTPIFPLRKHNLNLQTFFFLRSKSPTSDLTPPGFNSSHAERAASRTRVKKSETYRLSPFGSCGGGGCWRRTHLCGGGSQTSGGSDQQQQPREPQLQSSELHHNTPGAAECG